MKKFMIAARVCYKGKLKSSNKYQAKPNISIQILDSIYEEEISVLHGKYISKVEAYVD